MDIGYYMLGPKESWAMAEIDECLGCFPVTLTHLAGSHVGVTASIHLVVSCNREKAVVGTYTHTHTAMQTHIEHAKSQLKINK